jgi:hypothetical protein
VGTYDIGFAAVYGDASTYSLDISKLYLFNREAAIAAGCDETTLSSASFADRYKTVTAWKQIGSGNVTSHFSDGDKSLFTVGSDIFGKDGDDGLYVVAENAIADSAGSFYRYGGKLYLTDGQRIISVGEKSVTVPIPYIPVYARSCSQDGATFTAGEPLNIFCHYAKVEFDDSSELTRIIPAELFCGGTCTVYRSGTVLMSPSTYTFTVADGVGTLTLAVQTNATLPVCVSLSSSSSEGKLSYGGFAPARLAFCSSKTPLTVGTSSDGIRTAIAAGSGGLLYLMKQYGEAYVGDDFTAEYVGGEITALTPYDGGFFVLLSDSVKKLAGADGAMTISDFRGDAGCDAPKSVTQCGDMTVFAGLGGIYYICRYGITDRDESRRASLCASSALSEVGASDIIASEGIFTGEKYYLFAGDTALVWDVYAKAPQSKGSESDEKKLVWYALSLEGMRGVLGTSGGKVYYLADDGVRYFSFGDADGICPSCEFHSAVYYPEDVLTEKLLCKIEVCATLEDSATLSVYCDGIRLPDEYTLHASGENSVYKIGLPPRKFRGIAFGISGTKFKLIGLKAEYYTEV